MVREVWPQQSLYNIGEVTKIGSYGVVFSELGFQEPPTSHPLVSAVPGPYSTRDGGVSCRSQTQPWFSSDRGGFSRRGLQWTLHGD